MSDGILEKAAVPVPDGFRESAGGTGLIVPAAVSREEERWTDDDWKTYTRAQTWALRHGLNLPFICSDERCRENPICDRIQLPTGDFLIRCGHKDRLVKAFSGTLPKEKLAFIQRQERRLQEAVRRQMRARRCTPDTHLRNQATGTCYCGAFEMAGPDVQPIVENAPENAIPPPSGETPPDA